MKKVKSTIDDEAYFVIAKHLKTKGTISIKEIYDLFPGTNEKTISWRLYKLVQQGRLFREGHGYYSLIREENHLALGYNYLQHFSKEIYDFMQEYGYEFYLTGLDALGGELLHIPERFPVLVVLEEKWLKEVQNDLAQKEYLVLTENDIASIKTSSIKSRVDIILMSGKDFSMSAANIANKEKGFIDLYYAVTRLDYPLSIPEMSRTYESMQRNETVTKLRLSQAAKDRGIRPEIDWLTGLNNYKEKTKEFMKYQLTGVV